MVRPLTDLSLWKRIAKSLVKPEPPSAVIGGVIKMVPSPWSKGTWERDTIDANNPDKRLHHAKVRFENEVRIREFRDHAIELGYAWDPVLEDVLVATDCDVNFNPDGSLSITEPPIDDGRTRISITDYMEMKPDEN